MENLNISKQKVIKPDAIIFDVSNGDKNKLIKEAKAAFINQKRGDNQPAIMILSTRLCEEVYDDTNLTK